MISHHPCDEGRSHTFVMQHLLCSLLSLLHARTCIPCFTSSPQLGGVGVVQVLGVVRRRLETQTGLLPAAGRQRPGEDADGCSLREMESAHGHGAVRRQQLPHLGDQPVGEGTQAGSRSAGNTDSSTVKSAFSSQCSGRCSEPTTTVQKRSVICQHANGSVCADCDLRDR